MCDLCASTQMPIGKTDWAHFVVVCLSFFLIFPIFCFSISFSICNCASILFLFFHHHHHHRDGDASVSKKWKKPRKMTYHSSLVERIAGHWEMPFLFGFYYVCCFFFLFLFLFNIIFLSILFQYAFKCVAAKSDYESKWLTTLQQRWRSNAWEHIKQENRIRWHSVQLVERCAGACAVRMYAAQCSATANPLAAHAAHSLVHNVALANVKTENRIACWLATWLMLMLFCYFAGLLIAGQLRFPSNSNSLFYILIYIYICILIECAVPCHMLFTTNGSYKLSSISILLHIITIFESKAFQ